MPINQNQPATKRRLSAIRSVLRSKPMSYDDVAIFLGVTYNTAAKLMHILEKKKQIQISYKRPDSIGRERTCVYTLSQSYLNTLQQNRERYQQQVSKPAAVTPSVKAAPAPAPVEIATEPVAQPVVNEPVAPQVQVVVKYIERPSLFKRIKTWLFGAEYASGAA